MHRVSCPHVALRQACGAPTSHLSTLLLPPSTHTQCARTLAAPPYAVQRLPHHGQRHCAPGFISDCRGHHGCRDEVWCAASVFIYDYVMYSYSETRPGLRYANNIICQASGGCHREFGNSPSQSSHSDFQVTTVHGDQVRACMLACLMPACRIHVANIIAPGCGLGTYSASNERLEQLFSGVIQQMHTCSYGAARITGFQVGGQAGGMESAQRCVF